MLGKHEVTNKLLGTKLGQTQSRARQKIVKCKEADGVGVMILSGGMCIQYVKKKQRNKCFNPYRNFRKSSVNKRHTKMSKLQFNCMIYLFKKRAFIIELQNY